MANSLNSSVLALDAYNRGYNSSLGEAINGLGGVGSKIGSYTILTDSTITPATVEGKNAGFYAVAYKTGNDIVISYRGTDGLIGGDEFGGDFWNGYGIGAWGSPYGKQAELAIKFYQSVLDENPTASISFTGHSLGGGLAGLVAGIYKKQAMIYDYMPFEGAVSSAYSIASRTNAELSAIASGSVATYNALVTNRDALKALVYGTSAPTPGFSFPTSSIKAFHTEGEFLAAARAAKSQKTLSDEIEHHGDGVDLPGIDSGALGGGWHSMSTLIMLTYAHGNADNQDWMHSAKYFWPAVYDDDYAYNIGIDRTSVPGQDTATGKYSTALRQILAYSALEGTTGLVYGNTAIRAMFDDANDLGKVLKSTINTHITAYADEISEIYVQYAGLLGINKKTLDSLTAGILRDSTDGKSLIINMESAPWAAAGGSTSNIISKKDLFDSIVFSPDHSTRSQIMSNGFFNSKIASAMDALWQGQMNVVDRIIFANATSSSFKIDDSTNSKVTMFVGSDHDDFITGSSYNDFILGGKGTDIISGGKGKDVLDGGSGFDTATYSSAIKGITIKIIGPTPNLTAWEIEATDDSDSLDKLFGIEKILGSKFDDVFKSNGQNYAVTFEGGDGGDTYDIRGSTRAEIIEKPNGTGRDMVVIPEGVTPDKYYREKNPANDGVILKPNPGTAGPTVDIPPNTEDVQPGDNGPRTPVTNYPEKKPDDPPPDDPKDPGDAAPPALPPASNGAIYVPGGCDPLVFDINGDGRIGLTNVADGVYYDFHQDGFAEKSAWVEAEDGILVWDKDKDGLIEGYPEMIASPKTLEILLRENGGEAWDNEHGFAQLSKLDDNNDGVFDAKDKMYKQLRIWQDLNQDGISQTGELKTLKELSIKSIDIAGAAA